MYQASLNPLRNMGFHQLRSAQNATDEYDWDAFDKDGGSGSLADLNRMFDERRQYLTQMGAETVTDGNDEFSEINDLYLAADRNILSAKDNDNQFSRNNLQSENYENGILIASDSSTLELGNTVTAFNIDKDGITLVNPLDFDPYKFSIYEGDKISFADGKGILGLDAIFEAEWNPLRVVYQPDGDVEAISSGSTYFDTPILNYDGKQASGQLSAFKIGGEYSLQFELEDGWKPEFEIDFSAGAKVMNLEGSFEESVDFRYANPTYGWSDIGIGPSINYSSDDGGWSKNTGSKFDGKSGFYFESNIKYEAIKADLYNLYEKVNNWWQ